MKIQKRKSFKQLSQYERDRIESLRYYGTKISDIAKTLERDKGTISRELKAYTNKHGRYHATQAGKKAEEKRKGSKAVGMKIEANQYLKQHIINELKQLRSPDEIAGRMKKENIHSRVGTNAIYKWLYSENGREYCKYLCSRKIRKLSQSRLKKRHLIPNRISLRERPNDALQVHGESDLFVSPTSFHTGTVGHMTVVLKAHLLVGRLLKNRSSNEMLASMKNIKKKINVTTWTMDNGIENIKHEQFGVPTYFCTPGSPWQKPHVESSIGLTRRWFLPKGTDLSKISDETFQSMLFVLNHKYRKSLGYKSAYEEALRCAIISKIPKLSINKAVAFR
ncbi:MAG: IS30 family transposase [Minisyncoccia bacterium]